MSLESKYGISKETVLKMVNDGVIPCFVKNHYEIYDHYQRLKSVCPSCSVVSLAAQIEEATGVDRENVRKIIYKLGKIA